MENVIIKFTADTSGLQPAVDQLKLLGKITDEDARKIDEINQSQARYLNTLKATTKEAGNFSDEMSHLKNEIQAGILEGVAEHFAEMGQEMVITAKKAKSIRQELKELKAQIASGGLDGKELREATKRAGELADAIADANQQVKAFEGNRFERVLMRSAEAVKALSAGMSVYYGVQGLVGSENKELEKALLKVQSAMAILQGTQELTMLLQKESAFMIGVMEAKTYALAASQRVATVATKALGVEITASMAMATGGVSLLLAAFAYLVVSMDKTEEQTKKLNEKLAKMYENDKDIYEKITEKRLENLRKTKDGELKALELAYKKQHEADLKQFGKGLMSQQAYNAKFEYQLEEYNEAKAEINKKWNDKEVEQIKQREARKQKAIEDANKKELELIKEAQAKQELIIKDTSGDVRVEAFRQLTDLKKKELDLDKAMGENQKALQKSILEDEFLTFAFKEHSRLNLNKDVNDLEFTEHEDLNKKKLDSDKKYLEDRAKAEQEMIMKLSMLAIDVAAQTSDFLFNDYRTRLQNETEIDIAAQDEKTQNLLRNEELSQAQRQAIERMGQREIARLKQEAFRRQKNADIIQAGINTALGVTRSFATDPTGITAIAIGIAGGLQIAAIERQPIPKFAKGTKSVQGGIEGTDSVHAILMPKEMVIPVKTKEQYFPALEAIFDKKVSPSIANELLSEAAKGNYNISADYGSSVYVNNTTAIDYDRLDKLFSKNKSVTQINMDEVGFRKFVITENVKTEYLNKRFRK